MKNLKTSLLVAGALLLTCGTPALTRAQDSTQDPAPTQAAPGGQKQRGPELNLTDDQKAQMKKIHEDAKTQVEAINNDASLSAEQKQTKIQAIHRDTRKQTEALLTPEQKKTMQEWHREHRAERSQSQQQPPSN
jgi:periplasmic protein CpxP/Spy